MKKILALLMLAVFMISLVPAAFAENGESNGNSADKGYTITSADEAEGNNETTDENTEETDEEPVVVAPTPIKAQERTTDKIKDRVKEQAKERLQKAEKITEQKLQKLKEEKFFTKFKLKEFKARALTLQQAGKAHEALLKAKQKFDAVQAEHQEAKAAFLEAKNAWTECSGDCTEEKAQVREQAKIFLGKSLTLIEEQLAKTKAAVEGAEEITAEEAQTALDEIAATQAKIDALKVKVEAINEETTQEEVTQLAKDISALWKNTVKATIERHAAFIITNKIGGIIIKSNQLHNQLNKVMTRMADKGIDTSAVEPLVTDFEAKLGEAKTAYNAAQTAFKDVAAKTGTARNAALKTAQEQMRLSYKALQDAHKILKDIYKELKSQKAETILEDVESEEETLSSEETETEEAPETTEETSETETPAETTETTTEETEVEDEDETETETESEDNETGISA